MSTVRTSITNIIRRSDFLCIVPVMFKFVARADCGHLLGEACIAPHGFVEFVVAVLALSRIGAEIFPCRIARWGHILAKKREEWVVVC